MVLFIVGKSYSEILPALSINDVPIAWTDSLKYLRVKFACDKWLNVDISPVMRKFYAAVNAMFSEFAKLLSL